MPISQTEDYFENPLYRFLEESVLFLLTWKWNLWEKRFPVLREKSHFSNICADNGMYRT